MSASPLSGVTATSPDLQLLQVEGQLQNQATRKDPTEVARQFEAILVRQMLSESMKSLLESGKEAQVYGFYISEALADGITKGGGLGIRSILESQLRLSETVSPAHPGAETRNLEFDPNQIL